MLEMVSSTTFQIEEEFYHRPKPSSGPFFIVEKLVKSKPKSAAFFNTV